MKCRSSVHNIANIRINAPFPPFPMPSLNLIGFGTWRLEGDIFVSYLFIYYENHNQSTVIKRKDKKYIGQR